MAVYPRLAVAAHPKTLDLIIVYPLWHCVGLCVNCGVAGVLLQRVLDSVRTLTLCFRLGKRGHARTRLHRPVPVCSPLNSWSWSWSWSSLLLHPPPQRPAHSTSDFPTTPTPWCRPRWTIMRRTSRLVQHVPWLPLPSLSVVSLPPTRRALTPFPVLCVLPALCCCGR